MTKANLTTISAYFLNVSYSVLSAWIVYVRGTETRMDKHSPLHEDSNIKIALHLSLRWNPQGPATHICKTSQINMRTSRASQETPPWSSSFSTQGPKMSSLSSWSSGLLTAILASHSTTPHLSSVLWHQSSHSIKPDRVQECWHVGYS